MIYTEQIVRETLERGETFSVECKLAKREIPGTFWESFSAFANSDGGVIFLGVREENHEFTVEGVEDARKIVTDFWNMVHSPNKVSAEVVFERNVQIVNCGGKNIVVVEVPRAERQDRPVYVGEDVFRGTFRRNGEGDYRCSREAVKAMIRDQGEITADACMLEKRAVTDLNADTLRRYRTLFANLHPDHVWNRLPADEFLMKIGAAKRGGDHKIHPTVAGLVCFADFNTITDELPNFFLDYREHLSAGVRWTDRICSGDATWSGNVFDFFFRISQSITAGVKVPFKIDSDNVTRDDDTPVHKSIREVLANALIHADYNGRQGVVVEKYFKKLVISNPGSLRISKSVAIAGGTSDARNAKIFNIFSLVKIGERSGFGLSQLYGTWESAGYAKPVFKESFDPDRMRIEVEFEVAEKVGKVAEKVAEKVGQVAEKVAEKAKDSHASITETEEKIVEMVRENPHVTQSAISIRIGLTRQYVGRCMDALQAKGVIRRVGPDKGGIWEMVGGI